MRRSRVCPASVRMEFWGLVRQGLTVAEASVVVGVSRFAGMDWYRDRGGVMPRARPPATQRPRLTFEQREEIAVLHASQVSNSEIARQIGCHRSTIGRELAK
jgi:transposase, IS30 family